MDDLHSNSSDAKTVKIFSDEPADTTMPSAAAATDDAPISEAASKENAESANRTLDQPNENGALDQPVEAVGAHEAHESEHETASESELDAAVNGSEPAPEVAAAPEEPSSVAPASEELSSVAPASEELSSVAPASEELSDEMPEVLDAVFFESEVSAQEDDTPAGETAEYSTVRELGRDAWGRVLLAWRNEAHAADDQEPPVVLLERTTLDVEAARSIVDTHLYHARLLAPRAVIQREGGIYWLVVEAPATYDAPFVPVGDGGRLDVKNTLKAGVGLANALSYLHTNGVAHGYVGPDAVLVHDGRAYLSGLELASLVETTETASAALFSADVNALARVLLTLADLPEEPPADEAVSAQAIRAIAARAGTAGFITAEELAQECGQALQEPALTLPVVDEAAIQRALTFHCGTATTVGLLRSQNQDALGCTVLDIRDDVGRDHPLGIFLVADGMGGEAAGEVASRIGARIAMAELVRQLLVPTVALPALEPLSREFTHGSTNVATLAQALAIAVDAANRQVRSLAARLQESTGTTLTVIVVAGHRAVLAHLGDSRAYLMRAGTLIQLTKDHSLLARLQELDHPL
ncbi:MAG TPA: protein phosphatase 2C domain-containing protein, partial [Ktedonobacterales bacterium]|nr:protein phosphatase 2C domain-containing protein [Ktedonobacterales bacterium]